MLNTKKSINVLNWELKQKKKYLRRKERFLKCKARYDYLPILWSCDIPRYHIPFGIYKCPFSEMKPICFCRLNPKYGDLVEEILRSK